MKTLKFKPELIEMLRRGEKTVTWRMFDDKDLQEGEIVELIDRDTHQGFGTARLASILVVPLREAWQHHAEGQESFMDEVELLSTFQTYYGDRVTLDTDVKVITLKDLQLIDTVRP